MMWSSDLERIIYVIQETLLFKVWLRVDTRNILNLTKMRRLELRCGSWNRWNSKVEDFSSGILKACGRKYWTDSKSDRRYHHTSERIVENWTQWRMVNSPKVLHQTFSFKMIKSGNGRPMEKRWTIESALQCFSNEEQLISVISID